MSFADEVSKYIQFEFDGDKVVSAQIQSGWSERIDPEHFGAAALIAFHEQFAKRQVLGNATAQQGHLDLPYSAQEDLGQRVADFNRRALGVLRNVMDNLVNGANTEKSAPGQFTGGGGSVTVLAAQGNIIDIKIDVSRLKADSGRIEEGLVEALNQVEPDDDFGLGALRAEHAEFSRILNDYRRL